MDHSNSNERAQLLESIVTHDVRCEWEWGFDFIDGLFSNQMRTSSEKEIIGDNLNENSNNTKP